MKCDKYGNPLFQESDIFDLIYQEVDIDTVCSNIYVDDLDEFQKNSNIKFLTKQNQFNSIEEFDKINQSQWFIPDDYQNMDIEEHLVHVCPKENYERLIEELQEYRKRDMLNLLKLTSNCDDEQLLKAKEMVIKLHPDNSQLNRKYYDQYIKTYFSLNSCGRIDASGV